MSRRGDIPVGNGLRLTYIGQTTLLIELEGGRLLPGPVLGPRPGPLRRLGPSPDPTRIGPVDGILISHAHPDHFNQASIRQVAGKPLIVVPRGLASHVRADGA